MGLEGQRFEKQVDYPSESNRRGFPRGLDLEAIAPGEEEFEPVAALSEESNPQESELHAEVISRNSNLRGAGGETEGPKALHLPPKAQGQAVGWDLEEGGRMLPPLEEGVKASAHRVGGDTFPGATAGMGRDFQHLGGPVGIPGPTQHGGHEKGGLGLGGAHSMPMKGIDIRQLPVPGLSEPDVRKPPVGIAPLIPNLSVLDPIAIASSTWSRAETSRWAAPNVAGLLNASVPAVSLPGPNTSPGARRPLENPKRVPPAAVLPVPEDLAARASGAWHASLGHHGLPGVTQGLGKSTAMPSLGLGPAPFAVRGGKGAEVQRGDPGRASQVSAPFVGTPSEWLQEKWQNQGQSGEPKVSNKPSWLSLDLRNDQEESRGPTPPPPDVWKAQEPFPASQPLAPQPSPLLQALQKMAPGGASSVQQLAPNSEQLAEERQAWYEQFKANISNISAAAEQVPQSTWSLVQGAGIKPPSPVFPSPVGPPGHSQFDSDRPRSSAPQDAQLKESERRGKREADLLSRMEEKEAGRPDAGASLPPVAHAAGLIFGGSFNAVVQEARSQALKEIKGIALPPLLAPLGLDQSRPPMLSFPTPPRSYSPGPTSGIPPRALQAYLSTSLPVHDVLKPLNPSVVKLPDPGKASPGVSHSRGSPPTSISLKGWGGRSGPSSDVSSAVGLAPIRKRSTDGSDSGEEPKLNRQRSFDRSRKKHKGQGSGPQEPSTKLTLEMSSSEERGGGDADNARPLQTPRSHPSPSQPLGPGLAPSSLSGDAIASAAANTAYAAYLDSMKAGVSLSIFGGPARTTTPTGSSSGSVAAATAAQNRARGGSLLWRSSSEDTWNSESGDGARWPTGEGPRGGEKHPRSHGGGEHVLRPRVISGHSPGDAVRLREEGPANPGGLEPLSNMGREGESGQPMAPWGQQSWGLGHPSLCEGTQHSITRSSGTEGVVARSMASILGGYKAKLPGWPDKPMPADEYIEALQSSQFRLNVDAQDQALPEGER